MPAMIDRAGAPAVSLNGLTKDYGSVRALSDVNLTVEPGQVFGFLGPNGAGKTTAIRVILDLIRPTAGSAEVLGFDAQRDSIEVRRRVGYLPGELRLYEGMTAMDFFDLVASMRGDGLDRAYRDELIRRLELDATRRIGTLSTGNRQKVGVVQAMMLRPELLVLDEPTSGLDPLMQEVVEELLKETAADGRTVFFSSHLLAEVEEVCRRVAMLREGQLVDVVDLAEQRLLAPQRFAVTFAFPPPADAFASLNGVEVLSLDGAGALFETRNGIDGLLKCLANFTVERLESHELSLEDLFLSYYGGGAEPEREGSLVDSE